MRAVRIRFAVVLFLLFAFAQQTLALDPGGWWNSSTGSRILIWAKDKRIVVTVKTPKGRRFEYPGRWIEDGETFSYLAQKQTFEATFSHQDEIRVVNKSNGVVTVWSRALKQ